MFVCPCGKPARTKLEALPEFPDTAIMLCHDHSFFGRMASFDIRAILAGKLFEEKRA